MTTTTEQLALEAEAWLIKQLDADFIAIAKAEKSIRGGLQIGGCSIQNAKVAQEMILTAQAAA